MNINLLATVSREVCKFWDIRENGTKSVRTEKKQKSDFYSFAWKHDMNSPQFTVLLKDGTISSYDLRSTSLNQTLNTNRPALEINDIIWDNSDSVLFASATESGNGFIALFDEQLQQINF